jgi:nucleoside-diphosphate-sugar epimerase
MVASATMSGEIEVHGSGEQSRPLVHVGDAASTVLDVLSAPEEDVRGRVFNVTDETTGYSVADIAELVKRRVPGSRIVHHPAATDRRHYRVDGTRVRTLCRRPPLQLAAGLEEVADGLRNALWQNRACAQESNRARQLSYLLDRGDLSDELRWRE